jgi:SAM-dependent methyltransferase
MLDMAGVAAGARVLDVAAGAGGQTLAAARRVGPDGHVLATDISSNILAFADQNAREAGLRNVDTRVVDGEQLGVEPGSFDAVISRVGFIYFPDQHGAFVGMRLALRPGGRLAGIVYSTPEANAFFSIPIAIIRRRAQLPDAARRRARAAPVQRRLPPLRARVLRGAAPDARQAQRGRARGGVERDRARALPLRDGRGLRGSLRADRRRRDRAPSSRRAWCSWLTLAMHGERVAWWSADSWWRLG